MRIVLPILVLVALISVMGIYTSHTEYSIGGSVVDSLSSLFRVGRNASDDAFKSALKSANLSDDTISALVSARKLPANQLDTATSLTAAQKNAIAKLKPEQILNAQRTLQNQTKVYPTTTLKQWNLLKGVKGLTSDMESRALKSLREILLSKQALSPDAVLKKNGITDAAKRQEIIDMVTSNLLQIPQVLHKVRTILKFDPQYQQLLKRAKVVQEGEDVSKIVNATDASLMRKFAGMNKSAIKARVTELNGIKNKTGAQLRELKYAEDLLGTAEKFNKRMTWAFIAGTIIGIPLSLLGFLIKPPYFKDAGEDSVGRDADGNCTSSDFTCTLWNWPNALDEDIVKLAGGASSSMVCCCCCCLIMMMIITMGENESNTYF